MFPFLEKRNKTKDLEKYGLYVGDVHNQDGLKRFIICLLRGLMVFLACFGTVAGVIEAFDIAYNKPVVIAFVLFISMFASFLYINKPVFYIGYIVMLFGFTLELGRYYYYANSGYQAIVNIIYEEYSDYFQLLSLREAQEYISDRYLTVTVAMIFIATLLAILLNVTISGYMNLWETVLITFPFLEIAFYIEKRPPLYCMIMLLAAYICVGIQQAGRHFKMQVKGKHTPEYMRFRKKKTTTYIYQSTAKGTFITLLFSLVLSVVIGLGFYGSYYSEVPAQPTNEIRKTTDNYVKVFIQSGFTGLFDRYDSTGGLNNGRLGGVSSIRPDFETDLRVTFAPYSYDTIYLKSFVGSHYNSNQWSEHTYLGTYPEALELVSAELNVPYTPYEATSAVSINNVLYMSREDIAKYDAEFMPQTDSLGKMEILNVDAGNQTMLYPYYSSDAGVEPMYPTGTEEESNLYYYDTAGGYTGALNGAYLITYAPYLGNYNEDVKELDLPIDYDLYVNQFCLQIPEELKPTLSQYCAEQNFPGIVGGSFEEAPADVENINEYRLEVARSIYQHFVADFDYTMSPGATPYRQDFVEYFLTTQKRGVCAHFAASGTMLLRSMGIPARYVEGYCIPLSAMSEGQPVNENYDEWYQGSTQITEEGVLSVNVTDAHAHAWVEIYLEGYGFVPFEMTPPDFMDEAESNFNFAGLFDNFFAFDLPMGTLSQGTSDAQNMEREELNLLSFSFKTSAAPFLIMLASVAGCMLLIFTGRLLYFAYKKHKLLKEENYAELLYQDYRKLCHNIQARKEYENPNPLPDELSTRIKDILKPLALNTEQLKEIDDMFILFEKALYAPKQMTLEEYNQFQLDLKNVYQLLKTLQKSKNKNI